MLKDEKYHPLQFDMVHGIHKADNFINVLSKVYFSLHTDGTKSDQDSARNVAESDF